MILDEVDRALIHALHIDGRAPFGRVADVLGVSPQTVTRRYRRLREGAALRVVGLADHDKADLTQWVVRLTTVPAVSQALALSLARRPDTAWVKLMSGGTEIFAVVQGPSGDGSPALLLHDIPRRTGITAVSAHCVLHTYLGGASAWSGHVRALDDEQRRALAPPAAEPGRHGRFTPADRALLDVLRYDGRASFAELAAVSGLSSATAARRLADLRVRGVLFFDVELDDTALGVSTSTLLWLAVAPGKLDRVARTLAGHGELAVVMATTGTTNLVAQALCATPADLHRYLTRGLGELPGIRAVESAPVLRTVKAAGHFSQVAGR